jgi:hypothetical protein
MTPWCRRVLVGLAAVAAAALTSATASGVAPVRPCPENFPDEITRAEALEIDGAVLFDAVNKNGDDIVCFKPFKSKDGGVVKDNTPVGPKS